jgi:hypothetical protein
MPRRKPTSTERAERAKRETKTIDFKAQFDPSLAADWCELVKDFMAMANSGGGLIVLGVCDDGTVSRADVEPVLTLDPAKITDKVERYTGVHFSDFEIHEAKRKRRRVAVIAVGKVCDAPIAFTRPGTYAVDGDNGKQKTAFSKGTVYFRHGAKSEPATTADLREFVERRLDEMREMWLGRVRQVIEAPEQARMAIVQSIDDGGLPSEIRLTDDPDALVYGKLDPDKTHPFRQKELIEEVNRHLPSGVNVNPHDILSVRRTHGITGATHPRFEYEPRFASPKYSPAFAQWLLAEFKSDPEFFWKAKEIYAGRL